jgi:hypothetical protein
LASRHLDRGEGYRMRQPLRIHKDMPRDAKDFLAGIIAFAAGAVGVFDALRSKEADACSGMAPLFLSGRAHRMFLTPAPAGGFLLPLCRAPTKNKDGACALSENRSAAGAPGSRFLAGTGERRTVVPIDATRPGFLAGLVKKCSDRFKRFPTHSTGVSLSHPCILTVF